MKRILTMGMAIATLTAVAGCSPYSWQKQYGMSEVVSLDGPVRKNVSYVKGTTTFAGQAPAEMQARTIVQQPQVAQQINYPAATISAAPLVTAPNVTVSSAAPTFTTAAPAAVTVPPAFINGGQEANLQTRRVGDAGIVVFSSMIEEQMAQAAANRSCSNEGKTASSTPAVEVTTGVKQMNFTCS